MSTKQTLHEMVTSDCFTSGEWNEPRRVRQLLPVEAYTSKDWLERENRELFGRTWVFAGMTEDVKAPGDYKCVDSGNAALVLIRDPNNRLRAFHNVCRHRGARLLEGAGNIRGNVLTCFYHKWTYSLTDSFNLVRVPHEQAVFSELDRVRHALHPAKVATWKNLVFVHPDPDAEEFDEWLADIPQMLGPFDSRQTKLHDPELLVETLDIVYRIKANWKIVTENFIDGYHLPLLHSATLSDGDFMMQRWREAGRHQALYRPIKAGASQEKAYVGHYGDQPWPTIEGVPEGYGASYQWLFPNLALFQTARSWSTFHVVPVEPALSLVQCRIRAVPIEEMPDEQIVDPSTLPDHIVSTKGCCLPENEPESSTHPLKSGDVMLEDIYACEAIQRGMRSSRFSVGTLSQWEAPVTFFQDQILDYVPLGD